MNIKDISLASESRFCTERQREVLIFAMKRGYFDFPRKINLHEMSHILGVAESTLSEVLRAAERNTVRRVLYPPNAFSHDFEMD